MNLKPPYGVDLVKVETAREMLTACQTALPADCFIAVAAVADWRPKTCGDKKIKKDKDGIPPLTLEENPDILKTISNGKNRPSLVVGFAAETNDVIDHAKAKLLKKKCDWIVANDVSGDVMGGDHNEMILVTDDAVKSWPRQTKQSAARQLAFKIAETLS